MVKTGDGADREESKALGVAHEGTLVIENEIKDGTEGNLGYPVVEIGGGAHPITTESYVEDEDSLYSRTTDGEAVDNVGVVVDTNVVEPYGGVGTDPKELTPAQLMATIVSEMSRSDETKARALRMRAVNGEVQQRQVEEEVRRKTKREKRRGRLRRRKAERGQDPPVTVGEIQAATSKREDPPAKVHVSPDVMHESRVQMSEPTDEFRDVLTWSLRARDALKHVKASKDVLVDGFAKLAVEEAKRLEHLAAGNVVGDNDTRKGVAQQLVAAATGLRAIADGDWSEREDTPLQVSRSRRRFEKRVAKALAKERRQLLARKQDATYPEQTYVAMDDVKRHGIRRARRLTKEEAEAVGIALPHAKDALRKFGRQRRGQRHYDYHSGSIYEQPVLVRKLGEADPVREGKLRAVQAPAIDLLPTATVEISGEKKHIKIDTGAQYSVAGRTWAAYGEKLSVAAPVDFMEGFSGVAVRVLGVWRFLFVTQYRQRVQVDALLVDSETSDFLLGEDWMYAQGVKIDFVASEMKWYDDDTKVVMPFTGIGNRHAQARTVTAKVRLVRKARVNTQTLRNVDLVVEAADGAVGMFIPQGRKEPYLLLAPTLTTVRGGRIRVPIMNLIGRTTKLPSRETLGSWVPLDKNMSLLEANGELENDKVKAWLHEVLRVRQEPLSNEDQLKIGDMDDDDRALLVGLLRDYPTQLEPRQGCPPMTTLSVEHEIHTGNEAPIKVRPRRHAQKEHEVIDEEVDRMLNDEVIEEGSGAWGFPVVLVKKKDGSVRFCIDYRLLNAITVKDVYPLPRIDDTLESMHGSQRYTSLDLHAGYWQVPVAEKDKDKTGFVTRRGLFRFIRMPFGLVNAPGTFQRMMDAVLRGLTWQCCLVYLDDVIIFSKGGVPRHVVELATVLERLKKAGLSLKASKCSFAATRLEYLGHELDAEGVRPMESLVRSVKEFPVPKDEKDVKRFVRLAGYYRRFIASFGTKAAPMTKLLRKSTEWEWGPEQQRAFEQLKEELTARPLLAYPDYSKPFKLVTDASVVGLGAALMQDQGQGDQPIAYASKVNSPAVAKYGITDLECAAVVWAVKLFRPYLYGRKFELVTDHSALSWLMRSKDLTGRLHRWALQLQEYDFTIIYRPGSTNVVADALSRAPVLQVSESVAPAGDRDPGERREASGDTGQLTDEEIRRCQSTDTQTKRLKAAGRHGTQRIIEANGIVYVETVDGVRRVVLPAALRHKVLREAHDSIFACHLRTPQTYTRVATTYWWPDMRTTVRQWVQSCRDCGTRKARPKEVIPPLRSQGLGSVGDRWALDVAGPLPVTKRGNRYVIAAVEYATRYAIAVPVPAHTARDIARFVVERIVLVHGPLRELVMDGAPELNGRVIDELMALLQARQATPVPYRPALLGLVERFQRTWKDMVAMYVAEDQADWDEWLPCAVYAYNGARHTTTGFSPNELLMGRRLKAPNELLRASGVGQIGQWADYHRDLVKHMRVATETARRAAAQNQARREKYYNQRTRATTQFKVGDVVWILRPPKGRGVTKLAHRWVGPAKVVEDVGYDNWKLVRHDTGDTFVTHCSFLTSYHCPEGLLDDIARQTVAELDEEDGGGLSEIWEEPVVEHGEAADLQGVTEGELRPEPGQAIRPGLPETVPGAVETTQEDERRSGASPDIRQHIRQVLRRRIAERATSQRRQVTKSSGQSTAPTSSGMPDRRMVDGESGIMAASAEINKNSVAAVGEAENSGGRSPTNRIGATTKRRTRATSGSVRKKARTRQTLSSDANDDVEDEVRSHGQARSDARAARDTRAARRRADRDQQGATSTEETSADADRRLYDAGISSSCERRASAAGAAAGPGNVSDQEGAQQDDSKSPDASYDEEDAVHPVGGRGERDDEVGATVQTLRGRGRPRNQPRPEDPLHIEVHGPIVEWGRRRRRNRAGRYVLENQVEYRSVEDCPVEKRWLSIAEYEALLDGGKLGDELGGDVE